MHNTDPAHPTYAMEGFPYGITFRAILLAYYQAIANSKSSGDAKQHLGCMPDRTIRGRGGGKRRAIIFSTGMHAAESVGSLADRDGGNTPRRRTGREPGLKTSSSCWQRQYFKFVPPPWS